MIFPIVLGLSALAGLAWAYKASAAQASAVTISKVPLANNLVTASGHTNLNAFTNLDDDPNTWPIVTLNGESWHVSPSYLGPIGINEAQNLAKSLGMQLPTPQLVDAIWRQADLKLLPMPRNNVISQAVFDDQQRRIEAAVDGRPFTILGGAFKDVVDVNGHAQIYGWHVEDGKSVAGVPLLKPFTSGPGKIIQPLSGGAHDQPGPVGFKDYSQGARLVRKVV